MASHQMVPPPGGATVVVNGRTYSAATGASIASVPSSDRAVLQANGWVDVGSKGSGTTSARPTMFVNERGQTYLDLTLGYVIVWDGTAWRNPATGAAV